MGHLFEHAHDGAKITLVDYVVVLSDRQRQYVYLRLTRPRRQWGTRMTPGWRTAQKNGNFEWRQTKH